MTLKTAIHSHSLLCTKRRKSVEVRRTNNPLSNDSFRLPYGSKCGRLPVIDKYLSSQMIRRSIWQQTTPTYTKNTRMSSALTSFTEFVISASASNSIRSRRYAKRSFNGSSTIYGQMKRTSYESQMCRYCRGIALERLGNGYCEKSFVRGRVIEYLQRCGH